MFSQDTYADIAWLTDAVLREIRSDREVIDRVT